MNQMLEKGERATLSDGRTCIVDRILGSGGQGEVYQASIEGTPVALKWYLLEAATEDQRHRIEALVKGGPPDPRFLWPLALADIPKHDEFGYVMPLREARFKGIPDLLRRRVDTGFGATVLAAYGLADGYFQLHARGLCYQDISDGNVFFDPQTGDVLICDNDNVVVDGHLADILGTPRFMAPEIVRGEAPPTSLTDLYSLSVLLFLTLFVAHPLDGKREKEIRCLDLNAMNKLYGTDALFVFHPTDRSNEPDPDLHRNALEFWAIYPTFIRDLFTRAFVAGLTDTNSRVRETEWRSALLRLRDSIVHCQCGADAFYDRNARGSASGPPTVECWACKRPIPLPARLRVNDHVVMLNAETKIYPYHVEPGSCESSKPVAEVSRHPQDPNRWGLKNVGADKWTAYTPDGKPHEVEQGKTIGIANGLRISFGQAEGEIRG